MRNIYYLAVVASLLFSCTKSEDILFEPQLNTQRTFVATIEHNDTRVHADGRSVVWDGEDKISILYGDNNYEYQYFSTEEGVDCFKPVSADNNAEVSEYAVYPYSVDTRLDNGAISLILPSSQIYTEDSFGLGANTMVAQSSDGKLPFRNVGAYLKLKLYGEGVIKSIKFRGNNGEQLSGRAQVSFNEDGIPQYTWVESGQGADDAKMLILECNEGVVLKSEPTNFWLVIPPQIFENGFTITATNENGQSFKKSTTKRVELKRNFIQPMSALEFEVNTPPVGEIWGYDIEGNRYSLEIGEETSINLENFLPIQIDLETMIPSGDNVAVRQAIKQIVLPEGVTSIDMGAFAFCTSLESIILPESLETIGLGAFAACQRLTSIDIPDGVKTIGDGAFLNCSSLESVTLPNDLERMGSMTFAGATSLRSIVIPDSVTGSLGSTFYGCTSLVDVTLGANIVELNHNVFYGCTSLESITIPSNIQEIEEGVFEGCTSLKNVTFEENSQLRFIWNWSFKDCISLESITLPASLGDSNLSASDVFAPSQDEAENDIYGGLGTPIGGTASGFGNGVFQGCTQLKSIVIPSNVTTIPDTAFEGCTTLSSVTLSEGVEEIEPGAFENCTALKTLTLPNSLNNIQAQAFINSGLSNIVVPSGVELDNQAFMGCYALESVTLPSDLTEIKMQTFYGCSSLKSITIPESVTEIGYQAFALCGSLKSFGGKFASVDGRCLIINSELRSFAPAGLTEYTIPNGINSIGDSAFYGCSNLKGFGGEFASVDGRCLIISGKLRSFAPAGLAEYTIPAGVTSIGESVFSGCSNLISITIPSSVTEIGNRAFFDCGSLASVFCNPTTPPELSSVDYVFGEFNENDDWNIKCKIYVPSASVTAYKTKESWSKYANSILEDTTEN